MEIDILNNYIRAVGINLQFLRLPGFIIIPFICLGKEFEFYSNIVVSL